jgi:hypothetical protein
MKRQSHTSFARRYADMRAMLLETEGPKIAAFKRDRAIARDADDQPAKRERKAATSKQHHQQGSL